MPADEHVQKRGDHAVAGILGHRFHGGFGHALGGEGFGVAAHDAAHGLACGGQVIFDKLGIHIRTFLHKPFGRQRLPAPEHLHGKAQPGADPCRQQADKAGNQKGAHRQAECHDAAAQHFALRRFGQAGAQELFQPGDALAHQHHRVRQPGRVAEKRVQHEAAQYSPQDHHWASFVYWTVFTR